MGVKFGSFSNGSLAGGAAGATGDGVGAAGAGPRVCEGDTGATAGAAGDTGCMTSGAEYDCCFCWIRERAMPLKKSLAFTGGCGAGGWGTASSDPPLTYQYNFTAIMTTMAPTTSPTSAYTIGLVA